MRNLSLNRFGSRASRVGRSGFTLIEALVAVSITLIMMLALSQGFALVSQSISVGRAKLSLSDQLRGVSSVLREDLDGLTAGRKPLPDGDRTGYFEYYEGPLTDATAVLANLDLTQQTIEAKIPSSRYGDFDDIVSFTTRAKKGQWFYGEVPLPLIMGQYLAVSGSAPPYPFTQNDWETMVTVASDTAEIVYFMMPFPADPALFPHLNDDPVQPVNFFAATATAAQNYALQDDGKPTVAQFNDIDPNPTVPDRMFLCRRVLLVLPELNIPVGATLNGGVTTQPTLFYDQSLGSYPSQLMADPLSTADGVRYGMQNAYQRCDLSVRRIPDGDLSTADPIAANSLDDLKNPRNRFAHVMLPTGGGNTTMPIWSLTGPIDLQIFALGGGANFGASIAGDGKMIETGFIPPQFLRQQRSDNFTSTGIVREVSFSEVLATNCIGFDLKGYDANLPLMNHPGSDALPGTALIDDDNNSTTDDVTEFGWNGSDDLVLAPGDPGFAESIELYATRAVGTSANLYIARRSGFTDINWPVQSAFHSNIFAAKTGKTINWSTNAASWNDQLLHSPLSMTSINSFGTVLQNSVSPVTLAAAKSGRIVAETSGTIRIYQPGFDTFTDEYESDGYLQTPLAADNGGYVGTLWVNGVAALTSATLGSISTLSDRGTNGFDDNLIGGVDDVTEKETSPPIAGELPAIQAIIRVEDGGANTIQQIAVTHQLGASM